MNTITEVEFERLCAEVAADARELLIAELFSRVCRHVGLDPGMQRRELAGNYAFVLAQTVEESMESVFNYPDILHKQLLSAIRARP
jgi:hypothetical protein